MGEERVHGQEWFLKSNVCSSWTILKGYNYNLSSGRSNDLSMIACFWRIIKRIKHNKKKDHNTEEIYKWRHLLEDIMLMWPKMQ